MVVPAGTEEMVAVATVDHGRIDHPLYRAGELLCSGSFYLLAFLILMSSSSKNYQAKETVLVITVGFLVLYVVFKKTMFLDVALVIGLAGVFSFYLSEKIHWVWNKLSLLLAAISNRVLLGIVFFVVVTPMALIRRMRGKDGLRRFDATATSNFSRREQVFEKKDLENTW